MRMLIQLIFLLFFQFTSLICIAEKSKTQFLNIGIKNLDDSLYAANFCVPNALLKNNKLVSTTLSYGNEINSKIEVLLSAKQNDSRNRIFEVIFDKKILQSRDDIFINFNFFPINKKNEEFTWGYNMNDILSKSKNLSAEMTFSCDDAQSFDPARIGGKPVNVKM